jgi:hypothetical protein
VSEESGFMFDPADIELGLTLVKAISTNKYALGKLADSIETKYGDGSLGQFADAIKANENSLRVYRAVWRAWKDTPEEDRPSFSVARALLANKGREEWIKENPDATVREATAHVKAERNTRQSTVAEAKGKRWENPDMLASKICDEIDERLNGKWKEHLDHVLEVKNLLTKQDTETLVQKLRSFVRVVTVYADMLEEAVTPQETSAEPETAAPTPVSPRARKKAEKTVAKS